MVNIHYNVSQFIDKVVIIPTTQSCKNATFLQ